MAIIQGEYKVLKGLYSEIFGRDRIKSFFGQGHLALGIWRKSRATRPFWKIWKGTKAILRSYQGHQGQHVIYEQQQAGVIFVHYLNSCNKFGSMFSNLQWYVYKQIGVFFFLLLFYMEFLRAGDFIHARKKTWNFNLKYKCRLSLCL